MKYKNKYKTLLFILVTFLLLLNLGCCNTKYNYYIYKKKGEEALRAKNYKKAQSYFSLIYTNETSNEKVDTDKTTWAFYRLGVIAEVSGDLKMAKGYYWGDAIDEGFYSVNSQVNWLAQAGWNQLDGKNIPRTLEEILELEKSSPPAEDEHQATERKKEIIIQKKNSGNIKYKNNDGNSEGVKKVVNDSKKLPPKSFPEPFRVFY